jgi:hypothetical protein
MDISNLVNAGSSARHCHFAKECRLTAKPNVTMLAILLIAKP